MRSVLRHFTVLHSIPEAHIIVIKIKILISEKNKISLSADEAVCVKHVAVIFLS